MITLHIRSEPERSVRLADAMSSGFCVAGKESTQQDGFSCLQGIDERSIDPGIVFDQHSHRGVDIITYIVDGILDYRDTSGQRQLLMGGEVQLVSAGDGVTHSESNASHSEPLHVVQAWIRPAADKMDRGHYEHRYFPDDAKRDKLCLIASGDGRDGSVRLSQDAEVFAAVLRRPEPVLYTRKPDRHVWVQNARGVLTVNNVPLEPGDAAAIEGPEDKALLFQASEDCEFLLFDLP